MKRCSKCGELKPLAEFSRDKSKKCGYKSACKLCGKTPKRAAYMKQYRADNAEYFREKHTEFRERNREKLRIKRREYYDLQKAHDYTERNREHLLAYSRAYRATEKGKAVRSLHRARRRAGISSGDLTITLRGVFDRDTGRCRLCGGLCDYDDFILRDGVTIVGEGYPSIDHITPLSRGGTHTWDNVQLAHMHCNRVKSNKLK